MVETSPTTKHNNIDFTRFTSSLGLFISKDSSDFIKCIFSAHKRSSKPEFHKGNTYSIYEITALTNTLAITNGIIDLDVDNRIVENGSSLSMAIILDWQPQLRKVVTITIDDVHMLLDEELEYLKTKNFKEDVSKYYHRILYTSEFK
ncbi:hypothetical protein BALOs_0802 [Halobacteriovorax sp. BALOs_7]|uniref:hypothetical protein n=1 Tax=Halobacteriovorax sp. BALOs_7 TaxID=2109558 RepID=UPI000EA28F1F|nr:hypothetical protein [Halobacteriovorax sp. BALOs_7]AYF43812.1 hypothetical protein BALOs_0802 [Halobacteriovorax sp. BALOs_7]